MTAWTTRRGRPGLPADSSPISPTQLYHKWHAYDLVEDRDQRPGPSWDTKSSRLEFLERVAQLANRSLAVYPVWHKRYFEALSALGVDREQTVVTAKTVWRLLAGLATNPALETGFSLHLLHGFPYLPGSAVRGLVRRVAESELAREREDWMELTGPPPEEEISRFLAEVERLQAILGSLTVDPPDSGADPGWRTPRELLGRLLGLLGPADPETEPLRQRIHALLSGTTGGIVTFYDAVPASGEKDLLETDLLNPHYPDFYRDPAHVPPSDDQNAVPVYFLAVKGGATFEFPFWVTAWRQSDPWRDEPERRRATALGDATPSAICSQVREWLTQGLKTWGAGAKTAAGYGYFEVARK